VILEEEICLNSAESSEAKIGTIELFAATSQQAILSEGEVRGCGSSRSSVGITVEGDAEIEEKSSTILPGALADDVETISSISGIPTPVFLSTEVSSQSTEVVKEEESKAVNVETFGESALLSADMLQVDLGLDDCAQIVTQPSSVQETIVAQNDVLVSIAEQIDVVTCSSPEASTEVAATHTISASL
jgi:uncharacterized protein (UPF0212 family)